MYSISWIPSSVLGVGLAVLAGTARTLSDHLHALALVASVPGVRRIASAVESPGPLAEAESWHEPALQPPSPLARVGTAVLDRWITSTMMMRVPGLADSGILGSSQSLFA